MKMALKSSLRSKRSKRMCNVSKYETSKSDEMNLSSSDSESGVSVTKNKVREGFSTKRLLKDSECFKIDSDHIYNSVNPYATQLDVPGRKRKMSEENDEKHAKQKYFSKNALMAKLNRERKKQYVSSLETENESLRKQNAEMREEIGNQNKNIFSMRREILYLKGLLANSKELGQILKNLNETTGLPVTSSIVLTGGIKEEKTLEKSPLTDPENNGTEEYQPRIRSVQSGSNFPLLDKDINLSSCSDKSCGDITDIEHYPFDFENDSYDLQSSFLTDDYSFFNFNSHNLNLELEEPLKFQDFPKRDPDIGICLHVSQKRVSVEICSICNSRAGSSLGELPNELL